VLKKEELLLAPSFERMDLVALGTLADLMPLVDENRFLVRQGLAALRRAERQGLRQVFKRKELLGKRITTTDIAWQIAPLLNSAGRMGQPEKAAKLFLAATPEETESLVDELFVLDQKRKSMGEATWNLILGQARECAEKTGGRFVLVHDERVPRGITGIMASRLQGFFKAPAIVISEIGDTAVGSIRSNRGRVIPEFFARHGADFLNFGGHDFAGGFSLERAKLARFLDAFFSDAEQAEEVAPVEDAVTVDAEIPIPYLTEALHAVVECFEPYGEANPPLVFLTRRMRIAQCGLIGRKDLSHLKLLLDTGKTKWPAVYWNAAARFPGEFTIGDTVDVVYHLSMNTYGGGENLQLTIVDLRK